MSVSLFLAGRVVTGSHTNRAEAGSGLGKCVSNQTVTPNPSTCRLHSEKMETREPSQRAAASRAEADLHGRPRYGGNP